MPNTFNSLFGDNPPNEAKEWFDNLPDFVQEKFLEYPPNKLYLMGTHNVQILSYEETEDETACDSCTVFVGQVNNPDMILAFDRQVFGVSFDNLESVKEYTDA